MSAYHFGQFVGVAAVVAITIFVIHRARSKATVALAIAVAAGILIADASNFLARGSAEPWSTPKGKSLQAGFMNGCSRGTPEPLCRCMFRFITSQPAYETPDGFMTLRYGLNSYMRTGDVTHIPRVLTDAARNCRGVVRQVLVDLEPRVGRARFALPARELLRPRLREPGAGQHVAQYLAVGLAPRLDVGDGSLTRSHAQPEDLGSRLLERKLVRQRPPADERSVDVE